MKRLQELVPVLLSKPTPKVLVDLQGALLAFDGEVPVASRALEIAGRFHGYLSELQSKIAARDYSELASQLDIGAVGSVALENLVASEGKHFWQSLLLGGLGESLMVAASRQYVKGWEVETGLVHSQAAWYLAETLWHASAEMQSDPSPRPQGTGQDLAPEDRWQAIQTLLAPAYDPDVPAPDKAALLGRVFQMLLLIYLARLIGADAKN